MGAYWFTASTSFANPAVTLARSFTNTFSGIRPMDAHRFIAAQLVGAMAATFVWSWLVPSLPKTAEDVVMSGTQPRGVDPRTKSTGEAINEGGHS